LSRIEPTCSLFILFYEIITRFNIFFSYKFLEGDVGSENNLMKTTGKSGIFLSSRRRNWCAIHGNYLLWEMIS
jgi:hypothetical protein